MTDSFSLLQTINQKELEIQKRIEDHRGELDSVTLNLDRILRRRRCSKAAATSSQPVATTSNQPWDFYGQELEAARSAISLFDQHWSARVLGFGSLSLIFIATVIVAILIGAAFTTVEWPWVVASATIAVGTTAIVYIAVRPHDYFVRQGNHIILELAINVAQAALGDVVTVPTLDGEEELTLPAGTQTGEVFRMKGRGVPYLRRSGRGDQQVVVTVQTPTKLTDRQRELFEELGDSLGKEIVAQSERGFLDRVREALGL